MRLTASSDLATWPARQRRRRRVLAALGVRGLGAARRGRRRRRARGGSRRRCTTWRTARRPRRRAPRAPAPRRPRPPRRAPRRRSRLHGQPRELQAHERGLDGFALPRRRGATRGAAAPRPPVFTPALSAATVASTQPPWNASRASASPRTARSSAASVAASTPASPTASVASSTRPRQAASAESPAPRRPPTAPTRPRGRGPRRRARRAAPAPSKSGRATPPAAVFDQRHVRDERRALGLALLGVAHVDPREVDAPAELLARLAHGLGRVHVEVLHVLAHDRIEVSCEIRRVANVVMFERTLRHQVRPRHAPAWNTRDRVRVRSLRRATCRARVPVTGCRRVAGTLPVSNPRHGAYFFTLRRNKTVL